MLYKGFTTMCAVIKWKMIVQNKSNLTLGIIDLFTMANFKYPEFSSSF